MTAKCFRQQHHRRQNEQLRTKAHFNRLLITWDSIITYRLVSSDGICTLYTYILKFQFQLITRTCVCDERQWERRLNAMHRAVDRRENIKYSMRYCLLSLPERTNARRFMRVFLIFVIAVHRFNFIFSVVWLRRHRRHCLFCPNNFEESQRLNEPNQHTMFGNKTKTKSFS